LYHAAGLASLATFSAAAGLPRTGAWLAARVLLDSAGGLFGLYLAVMFGLLLTGWAMRTSRRRAARLSRPAR
jgi:hypothetical protein